MWTLHHPLLILSILKENYIAVVGDLKGLVLAVSECVISMLKMDKLQKKTNWINFLVTPEEMKILTRLFMIFLKSATAQRDLLVVKTMFLSSPVVNAFGWGQLVKTFPKNC